VPTIRTGAVGAAWIRGIRPGAKLLALVAIAVLVVGTPREWVIAIACYAAGVLALVVVARIPARTVFTRLAVEIPFVVFAALMPFLATGPRVEVLGMSLAVEGLWGAFALLSKATIVVLVAIVCTATSDPRRIVLALEGARIPRELTAIMGFMLRYLDVLSDERDRMRSARAARGFQARGVRSWRIIATGLGALLVRAHGRGERVHLAMLARGHDHAGPAR
jgi:cobalt/nickel transport system permease protein